MEKLITDQSAMVKSVGHQIDFHVERVKNRVAEVQQLVKDLAAEVTNAHSFVGSGANPVVMWVQEGLSVFLMDRTQSQVSHTGIRLSSAETISMAKNLLKLSEDYYLRATFSYRITGYPAMISHTDVPAAEAGTILDIVATPRRQKSTPTPVCIQKALEEIRKIIKVDIPNPGTTKVPIIHATTMKSLEDTFQQLSNQMKFIGNLTQKVTKGYFEG